MKTKHLILVVIALLLISVTMHGQNDNRYNIIISKFSLPIGCYQYNPPPINIYYFENGKTKINTISTSNPVIYSTYTPRAFTCYGKDENGKDKIETTVSYSKGMSPFSITFDMPASFYKSWCTSPIPVSYTIIVDDPVKIGYVKLKDRNDYEYRGGETEIIKFHVGPYYVNEHGLAEIQVENPKKENDWRTIKKIGSNQTVDIKYSDLSHLVNYGEPIKFRTKKKYKGGSDSYSYHHTVFYFFSTLLFPTGTSIKAETPFCFNDSITTINIPFKETNITYNITVKTNTDGSRSFKTDTLETRQVAYKQIIGFNYPPNYFKGHPFVDENTLWACLKYTLENPRDNSMTYMIADGYLYNVPEEYRIYKTTVSNSYIISEKLEGTVTLTVEHEVTEFTPSPFIYRFTVPPRAPEFKLGAASYTYANGYSPFAVGTIGGSGTVTFSVTGSRDSIVTLHVDNYHTGAALLRGTTIVNGRTYYSGSVTANLPAGIYKNIYVTNSQCTSTMSTATLREPVPVTFSVSSSSVTCNGYSNGVISVTSISGGFVYNDYNRYNISITNENEEKVSNKDLPAGTYTVSVSDVFGNTAQKTVVIEEPAAIDVSSTAVAPSLSCGSDGSITLQATGGTAPYSYSREIDYGHGTPNTLTGFAAGPTTVYIEDYNGCTVPHPVEIPERPAMSVTGNTATAPVCAGGWNGSCTLTVTDRQGALSIQSSDFPDPDKYHVSIDDNTLVVSGLPSGTYACTLRETLRDESCVITLTIIIPQKEAVVFSDMATTPVANKGSATGSCSFTVTGGNKAPYTVELYDTHHAVASSGETDNNGYFSANGLPAGTYTAKATDGRGCGSETRITIAAPGEPLQLEIIDLKHVSCSGGGNARVVVQARGGWNESYTYSHNDSERGNSNTFENLPAGAHIFRVTDKYGGTATVTATITEPDPLVITRSNNTAVSCRGLATGSLRYTIGGGTMPYTSPLTGAVITENTLVWENLPTGTYTAAVSDRYGCSATAAAEIITQPALLRFAHTQLTHTVCEQDNGAVAAQAVGGTAPYTYTLQSLDASFNAGLPFDNTDTVRFNALKSGGYLLTVTDRNGCTASSEFVINDYVNPAVADILYLTDATCYGESNGALALSLKAGSAAIDRAVIYTPSEKPVMGSDRGIFQGLSGGNYFVTVYDANNCPSNTRYEIVVQAPSEALQITVARTVPVAEKGSGSGKIAFTVQGGNTGNKTIRLLRHGAAIDSIAGSADILYTFDNLFAGNYVLQATDRKGCSFITDTIVINEPADPLRFTADVTHALCHLQTGHIAVTGTGGWGKYRYKPAADVGYTTANTFDNLPAGEYTITVIDSMGVAYSRAVTVSEPDALQAVVVDLQSPTCQNNGRLSVSVTGGTLPYRLHHAADTQVGTDALTVTNWTALKGGTYSIQVIDANGCTAEVTAALSDTGVLRIADVRLQYPLLPGAADGALEVIATGGVKPYGYRWTQDNTLLPEAKNATLSGIVAGDYAVTVTDAAGCSVQTTQFLQDPASEVLEIAALGHETAYEAANGYATVLCDGAATGTAYTLTTPENTHIAMVYGDSTTHYYFRNDRIYLQNLHGGHWRLLGKKHALHAALAEWDITPYKRFEISGSTVTPVAKKLEASGAITVAVTGGGGGNRFRWTTAAGKPVASINSADTTRLQALKAGTYTLLVTDRYGNTLQTQVTVAEPSRILQLIVFKLQHAGCNNYSDACVTLKTLGGWGDYRYRHETMASFETDSKFCNLGAGTHRFYTIDRLGVTDSITVQITEPEPLHAAIANANNVQCHGHTDGSIAFALTGGTAPYSWTETRENVWHEGTEAHGLRSGKYTFRFTDQNGCIGQDTITVDIVQPDLPVFSDIATTHTTCGIDNGALRVTPQGGTAPYSYRWYDAADNIIGTDSTVTDLKQNALYRVQVTDSNGCEQHYSQRINASASLKIEAISTTAVACYGDSTGSATLTAVTAATPYAPYSVRWSNGDTSMTADSLAAGIHHVELADSNGCRVTHYFHIVQPGALHVQATRVVMPACYGYCDGRIETHISGGAGEYACLWSNGQTGTSATQLAKGTYRLQVTDKNGCTAQLSAEVAEPAEQTVDLGDDVIICPGSLHVLDGGTHAPYRWYTKENSNFSSARFVGIGESGHYFLETTDEHGCPAHGDVQVTVGNSALQADFLMTSTAVLGDTIMIIELSNVLLDSLQWKYDRARFERLNPPAGTDDSQFYLLMLRSLQPGVYPVELSAYYNNCVARVTKQVEVVEADEYDAYGISWGYQEPLISEFSLYPNPNNGFFHVTIGLREVSDMRCLLYEVATGRCVDDRTVQGLDQYQIYYETPRLSGGMYVLVVSAGRERRHAKMIISP